MVEENSFEMGPGEHLLRSTQLQKKHRISSLLEWPSWTPLMTHIRWIVGLWSSPAWIQIPSQDFPDGAVVKNPPANAGHMGSSPGPGRSHMPRSN